MKAPSRTILFVAALAPVLLLSAAIGARPSGVAARPQSPSPVGTMTARYCETCHNDQAKVAGLSLSTIPKEDVRGNEAVWEKVLYKIGTGQMPPAGSARPAPEVMRAAADWLETALDRAAIERPAAGRTGLHRLNRTEYRNAIRDLLAFDIDADALLLPDEADEGFDNVAASLTVSPAHFGRYLSAARKISRLAVGDPTLGDVPAFQLYQVPRLLDQESRINDDLPFGSRGGYALSHHFPLDGQYVIKVRLRRQIYDYIIGMGHPQLLDIRVDGKRIQRFSIGGEAKGTPSPLTYAGEIPGDVTFEQYMHTADDVLEVRTSIEAGQRTVSVSFADDLREAEGVPQSTQRGFTLASDQQYDGRASVDSISIGGPYASRGSGETPSRNAIFTCRPSPRVAAAACARTILSRLAQRAYRRPPTEDEIRTLLASWEEGNRESGFDSGIQAALERILVSFGFLFRVERNPPKAEAGSVYRLTDVALASQLSFFLWSSIPDDELLGLAITGRLKDPATLRNQVRRMLADPKSGVIIDNFAEQWLGLRKLRTWRPDPDQFPDFDENLREAFRTETKMFLSEQFRADRSVLDLLRADYSFINERLAMHYGIPGVYGERFRRVTLQGERSGGLLGQGAILTVTSYPDRTSPVLRGLWVLDNMLGMRPPPPPPNVPSLETKAADGRMLSLRSQMELHRKNPACASCHVRMDPIGFAMENFDALGQWRLEADGNRIDASAVFTDGTAFAGARGLRTLILSHGGDFVRNLSAKMLTYALGRGLEYHDAPSVRQIVRNAANDNYRWSSIIFAIVNSASFQTRKSTP